MQSSFLQLLGLCGLLLFVLPGPPVADARTTLRALSHQAESGVGVALHAQLSQLSAPLPASTVCPTCLIATAPQAHSRLVQGSVPWAQLAASVRSYGLPQEVVERLDALVFARSVAFHTFAFTVNSLVGRGHYETYVGAGRRLDESIVEFGVVRSVVSAHLVAKTTPVPRRSCKRRFFVKRCRSWTEFVPRGLTANELRLVEQALRHSAVASAVQRVSSGSFVVRRSRRFVDLDDSNEIEDELAAVAPQEATPEPTMIAPADNTTLTELVRRGFDQLAVSSTSQTLRGIPVDRAAAFAAVFARSLQLPAALADPLRDSLAAAAAGLPDGQRRSFSVLLADEPGTVRFIRLALRRRSHEFDLASGSARLAVRFADRLQLLTVDGGNGDDDVEGERETIRIRRLPARVSEEDLRQALQLLRAASWGALGGRFSAKVLLLPAAEGSSGDF